MSLRQAADALGVHYMTAYRYVRTGRLYAERRGRQYVVEVADLERLLRSDDGRRERTGPSRLRRRLRDRIVAADEGGAWRIVEEALTSGTPPERIHLELLAPVMVSIGDDWATGRVSVADEHRASAVAVRLIGRLGPMFARRGPKRGTIVVGAPAGEEHALPGAMLSDILRGAGYHVIDLGADTPARSFADTARAADGLVAVLVGVTTAGRDRAVRSTVAAVRAAGTGAPVTVGGAGVAGADAARRLGADAWTGRDAKQAVAVVDAYRSASGAGGPDRGGGGS